MQRQQQCQLQQQQQQQWVESVDVTTQTATVAKARAEKYATAAKDRLARCPAGVWRVNVRLDQDAQSELLRFSDHLLRDPARGARCAVILQVRYHPPGAASSSRCGVILQVRVILQVHPPGAVILRCILQVRCHPPGAASYSRCGVILQVRRHPPGGAPAMRRQLLALLSVTRPHCPGALRLVLRCSGGLEFQLDSSSVRSCVSGGDIVAQGAPGIPAGARREAWRMARMAFSMHCLLGLSTPRCGCCLADARKPKRFYITGGVPPLGACPVQLLQEYVVSAFGSLGFLCLCFAIYYDREDGGTPGQRR
ncbi:hypothetical protein CYMTET_14979 [Cymbomonas tetramitiformis]|uniref:Uncharacterized protein n=1 Tax=Cymbomonas tetramitiformis TaxID=36881 RepID=A0AAE0GFA6_9CHLO|nr:hypothetical protein CYMTET_14979 [Cymbomonas tetramitiformis]